MVVVGSAIWFLINTCLTATASQGGQFEYPFDYIVGLKCGFIDTSGAFRIEPQFDFARDFSEGVTAVANVEPTSKKLRFFVIDKNGKKLSGNYGFLSQRKYGRLIAASENEFSYPYISLPKRSFFLISEKFEQKSSKKYDLLFETRSPFFGFLEGGKAGLLDIEGAEVVLADSSRFGRLIAPDLLLVKSATNRLEMQDLNGTTIKKFGENITEVLSYSEGLFITQIGEGEFQIQNIKGDPLFNFSASVIREYSEGLACFIRDNRMGAIDSRGNIVVPPQFYDMSDFSEGMASVRLEKDGRLGYIDTNGRLVIQPKFLAAANFHNGMALVKDIDNLVMFIKNDGTNAFNTKFSFARPFSEGLACACTKQRNK